MNEQLPFSLSIAIGIIMAIAPFIAYFVARFSNADTKQKMSLREIDSYAILYAPLALGGMNKESITSNDFVYCIALFFTVANTVCCYFAVVFFGLDLESPVLIIVVFAPILLFLIGIRIWCISVVRVYIQKQVHLYELEEQFKEQRTKLIEDSKALQQKQDAYKKLTNLYKITVHSLQMKESAYTYNNKQIQLEQDKISTAYNTVAYNLALLKNIPDTTKIAVDTNIFMEWDNYLIEALKSKNLLISKRVQWELDKNKNSDYDDVRFKARRGIRRLLEFPAQNYSFINGDWNDAFLKKHGLSDRWEDEKILADYLTCQQRGEDILIASSDSNFLISAKSLFSVLSIKNPKYFIEKT